MIQKNAYDIVCFLQDEESRKVASEVLTSFSEQTYKVFKGGLAEAVDYIKTSKAKIICVDLSQHELLISSAEELIEVCPPETLIIVVGDRNDVGVFRDLIKRNVADYLAKPLNSDIFVRSLRAALNIESNLEDDRRKRVGKMIVFLGTVGGIGTTTLATNCAYMLAEELGKLVVLIDGDFQFGHVVTLLDLKPSHTLHEAIMDTSRVDDMFLENSMAQYGERLRVFSADEPLHEHLIIESDEFLNNFDQLLEIISRKFHYIIVDMSKQHPLLWRALCGRADKIFLVSGLSIPSLRDTMKIMQSIDESSITRLEGIIINRIREKESITLDKFKDLLGHPVDAVISYDPQAPIAADLGEPLVKQSVQFHLEMSRLIENITGLKLVKEQPSFFKNILEFFPKWLRK